MLYQRSVMNFNGFCVDFVWILCRFIATSKIIFNNHANIFTTARKAATLFCHTESFFVRHLPEYKTGSDNNGE